MQNKLHILRRWHPVKNILKRFVSQKIHRQIVINYVGLGLIPIIIVSFILINLSQNTVRSYLNQRNMEMARRASNEISLFIREPLTILNTLVQTRDILEMERFTQSRIINKIKLGNSIFQKIFILDHSGTVVVTTSFGEEMKEFSRADFFQAAMGGRVFYSQVYFGKSGFPSMRIAIPIKKYNVVEGVLVGEIDLKSIWELVDNITIGKTGNAFLISSDGLVIAHPDKQRILRKKSYASYPFFQKLIRGEEGITIFEADGKKMIAAFSPIPELNWGIIIQQTYSEAFDLIHKMRNRVILFSGLTLLLALFLAVFSMKRITQPLDVLVQGVREYARGNLGHRIQLTRRDEIAELAKEFNAMAESLNKNQRKLRRVERLAALSRFASFVSHEIRNPLNAMNINMQILRRLITQADTPLEKKFKYLNIISSEIERMNALVTNFLTIARPPELNLIRADLRQILDEVVLLQEARARSEKIRIIRKYPERDLIGMFDYNQMKQVFHNIIVNAFEAMPSGGKLFISMVFQEPAGSDSPPRAIVRFEDTGQGIPQDKLSEIWEPYFTSKKTGTGLGLAIVKQIVEGHGGKVKIESRVGEGTVVIIELPLGRVHTHQGSETHADSPGTTRPESVA